MTTEKAATRTLYERLGGYDAIAAATDDLLARLMADPQLGGYWKGASNDNKRRGRQLIVEYLCEAAGGPAFYVGRDMKTSHVGMGITPGEWVVFMRHVAAMLDHLGVVSPERDDVLSFVDGLQGDIVEG